VILAYIRLLYDVEREARKMGLTGEARKVLRRPSPCRSSRTSELI